MKRLWRVSEKMLNFQQCWDCKILSVLSVGLKAFCVMMRSGGYGGQGVESDSLIEKNSYIYSCV